MRNYRIQTTINFIRLVLTGEISFFKLATYTWWWFVPSVRKEVGANKFYDVRDFRLIRKFSLMIAAYDPLYFPRLIEPTTLGIRAWEYGVLLSNVAVRNKKILDLGVGSSRLPYYLSYLGAKVTAVDLETPMEGEIILAKNKVKWVKGDMTDLSFGNNSFDVVLNISAMEHLDADYPSGIPVDRATFLYRTERSIREMVRVCKKGGVIYVTTDFFLPAQKTDSWQTKVKYKGIGGVYRSSDINRFVDGFENAGCEMVGKKYLDFDLLKQNSRYSNFRGRYFTTASFLFRKL